MKTVDQQISANQINDLREAGMISEKEIAYVSGDLVVAENVLSGDKRIIGKSNILSEGSKRILKG